jgi:hypothetical protein
VREGLIPDSVGEAIVTSRLLVLQSKRLLLTSTETCLVHQGDQQLHDRAGRLRSQTESAQHAYRAALLKWGSTQTPEYWVVAYTKLIDLGSALITKLRSVPRGLSPAERLEVATDVEMLEDAVDKWREQMRASMAAASG